MFQGLGFMMKPKMVLDTNCIIDLEENRSAAHYIRLLIKAWKNEDIELAVVAVSASENQRDGTANRDFGIFKAKLSKVGLNGVHTLLPLNIWNLCYWNHCIWSSKKLARLELKVRSILFPGIVPQPPTDTSLNSSWRNQMCDVLIAWSCIHHKWEYLVTRDKNFHNHKHELATLDLCDVLSPKDAAYLCEKGRDGLRHCC